MVVMIDIDIRELIEKITNGEQLSRAAGYQKPPPMWLCHRSRLSGSILRCGFVVHCLLIGRHTLLVIGVADDCDRCIDGWTLEGMERSILVWWRGLGDHLNPFPAPHLTTIKLWRRHSLPWKE